MYLEALNLPSHYCTAPQRPPDTQSSHCELMQVSLANCSWPLTSIRQGSCHRQSSPISSPSPSICDCIHRFLDHSVVFLTSRTIPTLHPLAYSLLDERLCHLSDIKAIVHIAKVLGQKFPYTQVQLPMMPSLNLLDPHNHNLESLSSWHTSWIYTNKASMEFSARKNHYFMQSRVTKQIFLWPR